MKTQTIQQIEEKIEQIESALDNFVVDEHKDERYGPEQEYTSQSLKHGLVACLTDLRGLVESPSRFVQLSTHDERNRILGFLEIMIGSMEQENYNNLAADLDGIKSIMRNYNVRGSSETQTILEERANRINAQCSILEEKIQTVEKIKTKALQSEEKIQTAETRIDGLNNLSSELQNKHSQTDDLQNTALKNDKAIEQILTSAKSHEEVINNFSQRVEKREEQLDQQEQKTTSYQENLALFEKEHKEKLEESEELINQARDALSYTTSAGISAAFDARYIEERNKEKKSLWWLIGAAAFVCGGIWVGFQLTTSTQAIGFELVLSRIAIMSLVFSAAWFCAGQYVKYKNTLEDYGYKTVLAKSMVAFLDQLSGKDRERYLKMVLFEIHQDPLRKKHDVDTPASKFLRMFENEDKDNRPEPRPTNEGNDG